MPLFPAHPAVVLPLRRTGLPLPALVAGAVAPDAPVYLPLPVSYATTHSSGGIAIDVVIGVVGLWLWTTVVRDAVVDLVPVLRSRVPARTRPSWRTWLLAPVAVAVGAATHVLWDSATHEWGFVVEHLPFLQDPVGGLPWYGWLQHLSTVVGALVVAAWGVSRLRRRPVAPRPPAVRRPGLWLTVVPSAVLVVALVTQDPEVAVGAALVATVVLAGLWRACTIRS